MVEIQILFLICINMTVYQLTHNFTPNVLCGKQNKPESEKHIE